MSAPHLIGLSGRPGAGQRRVAQMLCQQHGFVELALAEPIRRGLAAMLHLHPIQLTDPALLELPLAWLGNTTPQRLLCTLRTGWGQQTIGADIWRAMAERSIDDLAAATDPRRVKPIVVPDLADDADAAWLRGLGGVVWHVVGSRPRGNGPSPVLPLPGDRTIDNTGHPDQPARSIAHALGMAGAVSQ